MNSRSLPARLPAALLCRLSPIIGADYQFERKQWERVAATGDPAAQYRLSNFYENGWGVPVDHRAAAKWYLLAAIQGHADAQYNLALMYPEGRGVAEDAAEAAVWLRLAAEAGDKFAQCNLGALYEQGQGVTRDRNESMKGFFSRRFRATPLASTMPACAIWTRERLTTSKNRSPGWNVRRRAAIRPLSTNSDGSIRAIRRWTGTWKSGGWFQRSAEQGEPLALFALGPMAANGEGARQDPSLRTRSCRPPRRTDTARLGRRETNSHRR
jgi:hypothetical protein